MQGDGDQSTKEGEFYETSPHFGLGNWLAYPYTKALAELEVRGGIEDGLWATIVNPGGILGKYDKLGFARTFRILKDGAMPAVPDSVSPVGDVEAVAASHIAAAERGKLGRNYNLCGRTVSLQEIARLASKAMGEESTKPVLPSALLLLFGLVNEPLAWWTGKEPDLSFDLIVMFQTTRKGCNSDRAVKELGYQPIVTEDDVYKSLKSSYDWLVENNEI